MWEKTIMARHPYKALTATTVNKIAKPGRYTDGKGLHLYVDKNLRKRWVLRVVVKGHKRMDLGLGGYPDVGLAEEGTEAKVLRSQARRGINPVATKQATLAAQITFAECARKVHESYKPSWKNPKHGDQWINTLEHYAFPVLGDTPVSKIGPSEVLEVLGPIWLTKQETARRVRQRIRTVFDWAKASGHCSGDNPVDGVMRALPKQQDKAVHHHALPYEEVPAFIDDLHELFDVSTSWTN
jgi:hypothetical protein